MNEGPKPWDILLGAFTVIIFFGLFFEIIWLLLKF